MYYVISIMHLIPKIFSNYKNKSGRGLRWSQTGTGRVSQSVSFLKTLDKRCINLAKITSYIEYLMRGIFSNNNKYMSLHPMMSCGPVTVIIYY